MFFYSYEVVLVYWIVFFQVRIDYLVCDKIPVWSFSDIKIDENSGSARILTSIIYFVDRSQVNNWNSF